MAGNGEKGETASPEESQSERYPRSGEVLSTLPPVRRVRLRSRSVASRADISDLGSRVGLDDIILEVMTAAGEHPEDYTEILATLRRAREAHVFAVDEPADCDGVAEALEEAADEILAKGEHSNAEGHFRLLALELRLAARDFSSASSV